MDSDCIIKKIVILAIIGFSLLNTNLPKVGTVLANTRSERQRLRQEVLELEKQTRPFVLTLQKVSQLVKPSVVSILTERKFRPEERRNKEEEGGYGQGFAPFGLQPPEEERRPYHDRRPQVPLHGFGSGVIMDERGYVLTNYHLLEGFEEGEITVTLHDGKNYKGSIVGEDPNTDLAVLKIEGSEFEAAEFGDSAVVEVGDWVIAIGSPFGYQQTVSAGIISAKGRTHIVPTPKPFAYEDFLQTDAAINPGNSGGPLVNLRGEVIGINAAIVTRTGGYQGIGFAISSSIAKETMLSLIERGRVVRGYLGVGIEDISDDLATYLNLDTAKDIMDDFGLSSQEGAFVTEVWQNTPAWKAGILPGDVVIEIDSQKVSNASKLQNVIRHFKVGSVVTIKVVRNKTERTFNVKIEEQPGGVSESAIPRDLSREEAPPKINGRTDIPVSPILGITVEELTPQMAKMLGYESETGVVVKSVETGSLAEKAGIDEGDVISQVGRSAVKNVVEFVEAVTKSDKEDGAVVFLIKQKGFIRVK